MKKTLAAAALCLSFSPWVGALPEGSQVIRGGVQVTSPQSHILEVLQSTPQAIVHWNSFNVQLGETVRFLQPGAQAVLLNRVVGGDPSHILGQITATGQVFLVNPNGILFGPNSVVNAGSFVASTLDIHDQDFMDKRYQFQAVGDRPLAGLTQQGHLEVAPGGFLVLLSPLLDQQGVLVARQGTVQLGATSQASLSIDAQGLLSLALPQAPAQAGTVLLTPQQMSDTLSQVISAPNLVEAGDIVTTPDGVALVGGEGVLLHQGQIEADRVMLNSTQATVLAPDSQIRSNGGRIDALSRGTTFSSGHISNPEGFVEISGRNFLVNTPVDVGRNGTLFLDPGTLRVTNGSGSDTTNPFQAAGSDATVNALVLASSSGSVILQADDDIIVESDVNLVFANTVDVLFDAGRDIVMEGSSSLAASNSASTIRFEAGNSVSLQDVFFNNVEVEVNSGVEESFLRGDLGRAGAATSVNVSTPNLTIDSAIDVLGTTAQVDLSAQINFGMNPGSQLRVPGGTVSIEAQNQVTLSGPLLGTTTTQFDLQSVGGLTMLSNSRISAPHTGSRVSLSSADQVFATDLDVPEIAITAPIVFVVGPSTWGAVGLPLQADVSAHQMTLGGAGDLTIEGTRANVNFAVNTSILAPVGITFGDTPGNLNVTAGSVAFGSDTEVSGAAPVNITFQGGRFDLGLADISLPAAGSTLDVNSSAAVLLGNVTVADSVDAQTTAGNVRVFGEVRSDRVTLATPASILGVTPEAQVTGLQQLNLSASNMYGLGPQQTLAIASGAAGQVVLNISGANFPDSGPPELPTPEGFAGSLLYRFPQSSSLTVNAANNVRVVNEPAPAPEPTTTTTITSRQDLSSETQAVVTAQLAQSQMQLGNLPPASVDLSSGDWEGITHTNEGLTSFYAASPSSMVVETVVLSPEDSGRSSERRERVASATLQVLSEAGESDDDVKFWRALVERVLIWEESD